MKILAIETSCDETGLALIKTQDKKPLDSSRFHSRQVARGKQEIKVLANLVRSQIELHKPYGGVYPNLAKREHKRVLPLMWRELIETYNLKPETLDLIVVTQGPGLSPCLWQGINFAENLSQKLKTSLIGINHLKGHIYIAFLNKSIEYPILSLIVSGGHSELIFSEKPGDYQVLGRTRDDAAGEAFDKVARLLELSYPGGPEISRVAKNGNPEKFNLPRPMINTKDFDFSFAGLKTAGMYLVKGVGKKQPLEITEKSVADVAASFQQAVVDVLVEKTIRAAKKTKPKTIILGGGVAANQLLREELKTCANKKLPKVRLILPDLKLTTDNALMIALAAWYEKDFLKPQKNLKALPNLKIDEK